MSEASSSEPPPPPASANGPAIAAKKLAIWGGFILLVYLARDFFFVAFMTFMFCYLTQTVVGWGMRRLSPSHEREWLRRLFTIGVFFGFFAALVATALLLAPRLLAQGHRFAGWAGHANPEAQTIRVLGKYVGPIEFKQTYGAPGSAAYEKGLEEFHANGIGHAAEYRDFPSLQAWVEAGFNRQFAEAEQARLRRQLAHEGTSGASFQQWYAARKTAPPGESEQAALDRLRRDPVALAAMQKEWIGESTAKSPAATSENETRYQLAWRDEYARRQRSNPAALPYTLEQYAQLRQAYPLGQRAFAEVLDRITPAAPTRDRLRADFESAKAEELFETWWADSAGAKFIQQHLQTLGAGVAARVEGMVGSMLNVPLDLATALLLSVFICIDFPRLRRGSQQLGGSRVGFVYDEIAPALSQLGRLIGRAMQAQGIIALCNATLIFIALKILGVEHEMLLAMIVFVLCLVPTAGAIIACVIVTIVTLLQHDGGVILALKTLAAFAIVIVMESTFLSPRILGQMMDLHPVLIIGVLPVAQYFFGIWGLILALPVTVYLVRYVMQNTTE